MSFYDQQPYIPLASFKNIVVTVTEDETGRLLPNCVELINCSARDTILNFQLTQPKDKQCDYRFDPPEIKGDVSQLGTITISRSGKMLTVCNEVSEPGSIFITLKVYDKMSLEKRGSFDPEVANQPEG
ncbi:hypothetical protein [Duganella sp. Root1480D1]|uniref:hypothetical protein n=1 Tax=Duganella sp. Root1480D1 TaxID=1736471 RepID=UPI00070EAC12|nr:hypothetical protein [Duganella sp. Root1480D1]KQZ26830.1 hypothetical protein ASD58_14680 [Duganella sp. Root1480D1]